MRSNSSVNNLALRSPSNIMRAKEKIYQSKLPIFQNCILLKFAFIDRATVKNKHFDNISSSYTLPNFEP